VFVNVSMLARRPAVTLKLKEKLQVLVDESRVRSNHKGLLYRFRDNKAARHVNMDDPTKVNSYTHYYVEQYAKSCPRNNIAMIRMQCHRRQYVMRTRNTSKWMRRRCSLIWTSLISKGG